ncbi:MAG: hypothetical protein KME35_12285 [Aphanocapsa sp. GSE-SYN-MK-11-07L]|jgi:hypothetical protein|nr:hypothetical protein [Aphanocapsa sp. GSE-SYN-MK-11-07L]
MLMRLSPVTRFYLRKLLQQKSGQVQFLSRSGLAEVSIEQILDKVFVLETMSTTSISDLEVVLRLHQRMKLQKEASPERLEELETRIFQILELQQRSPSKKLMIVDGSQSHPASTQFTQLTVQSYLDLLNRLSLFSQDHVGRWVVVNYWETARPSIDWLERFQINSAGVISFTGITSAQLTLEHQQDLNKWIERFIGRCNQAVPNFRQLVEQAGLTTSRELTPAMTAMGMS